MELRQFLYIVVVIILSTNGADSIYTKSSSTTTRSKFAPINPTLLSRPVLVLRKIESTTSCGTFINFYINSSRGPIRFSITTKNSDNGFYLKSSLNTYIYINPFEIITIMVNNNYYERRFDDFDNTNQLIDTDQDIMDTIVDSSCTFYITWSRLYTI